MSKRPFFSENDLEEIYQGEKLLYESMRRSLSFVPTMSWEEHCEFTGRHGDRIAKERAAASASVGQHEQQAIGRRGKSLQAKKAH